MQEIHPLREYREAKGITATKLAEELGVKRNTIWRWENWKRRIDPSLWDKIHATTGVPKEHLALARKGEDASATRALNTPLAAE